MTTHPLNDNSVKSKLVKRVNWLKAFETSKDWEFLSRFKTPFSANGSTIHNELIRECCRSYSSHTPAMFWRMPLRHLMTTTTIWLCDVFVSCWTWTSNKSPQRRPQTTSSGQSLWRSLNNDNCATLSSLRLRNKLFPVSTVEFAIKMETCQLNFYWKHNRRQNDLFQPL